MLFLQQNSEIMCTIVGSLRRSQSLPQGALELPSTLTFAADSIMVSKVEALLVAKKIDSSVGPGCSHSADDNLPKNQKIEAI